MDDLTLLSLLLANVAIFAGAFLQGLAGYGIGTLSAPLLFLVSPLLVPGPLVLNAVLLTVLILWRSRTHLAFRQVRFAMGGDIVGTLLAVATLAVLTPKGFELIFGVLILIGVMLSVAGLRPRLNARNSLLAGGASGYMGTITAVGGPPIALIYQNEHGPLVRANMSAFFLFASFASAVALFFSGFIGPREWGLFAALLPGTLLGFLASGHLVHRVPFAALRPLILGIAAIAGIGAVVKGLLP
ncbi:MAG: sulfite exporter TauE/SafE family protein [Halothiobacillaceae bacterium]|nr:sulfite exporter TauE/SafE family protein [Halothiobacillaceae bacterium]